MNWTRPDDADLLARLTPPSHPVRMVLDTDTYNEIDDQFALVYALLACEAIETEAIYAAPFHNDRSNSPGDGMERSYEEILRLLDRLGRSPDGFAFKGSTRYLPDADAPIESPAASDLIAKAMKDDPRPLYVATIGAPTNVSSALLLEPDIRERIVVVWLGGQPLDWHTARDFNLQQDIHASRILFDSGVPLVQMPCSRVTERLRATVPEIEADVRPHGVVGEYLCEIFVDYMKSHRAESKVIWDIAAIAWLLNPDWIPTEIVPSPILTDNFTWDSDDNRHPIRIGVKCDRDAIFGDLFQRLADNA
jgi:inosine-uridine nucleoside N-ribohydrolase